MYKALLIDPEILLKDKLVNALNWNEHGFQLQLLCRLKSKNMTSYSYI
jgi:ABC-type oligopeptide transport system ATPase subunit